MPLHLLGKKSWNVYNTENLERVKRDEAILAAHEAEIERRMQEHDAAVRAALLRGLPRPSTPSPPPAPDFRKKREDRGTEGLLVGREGKRRRLAGEDDTDRDIRLARSQNEALHQARAHGMSASSSKPRSKPEAEAPLFDHNGHVNLFPVDEKAIDRANKKAEAEAEAKKKKQEQVEQLSMRFSEAAGRDGLQKKPWYGTSGASAEDDEPSKDVWGRPDPARKARDTQRVASSDPLAFMKTAQVQLKQAERDRDAWGKARYREERELREAAEKERKRKRRRDGKVTDESDLEGFSLDHIAEDSRGLKDGCRSPKRSHRHRRRRSRSRSRTRDHSPARDRRHDKKRERSDHTSHRKECSRGQSRDRHQRHDKESAMSSQRK